MRNGAALCAEGEALLAQQPKVLKRATWRCYHGEDFDIRLQYSPCLLMDVGKERRERRRIYRLVLCTECWEQTKDRLLSSGARVVWQKEAG